MRRGERGEKTDTVTLIEEPAGGTLEDRRRTSTEGDWNRDGATHHCRHARDWHGPDLMRLDRASVFTAQSPGEQLLISRELSPSFLPSSSFFSSSFARSSRWSGDTISAAALCRPRAPANQLRRPRDQDGLCLGRSHSCWESSSSLPLLASPWPCGSSGGAVLPSDCRTAPMTPLLWRSRIGRGLRHGTAKGNELEGRHVLVFFPTLLLWNTRK